MSARDEVLGRIGKALGRATPSVLPTLDDQPVEVSAHLGAAQRSTLPATDMDTMGLLIRNMESVLMSVDRVPATSECESAVTRYLEDQGIDGTQPGTVTVSPALSGLAWPSGYGIGSASGAEQVGITPCIAAVAETGSIVTVSSSQTPASLNFLPETHIVVVQESQVVRYVEDVFAQLRAEAPMPRAVNFITGPSRTADIEQTLEIGAHGPRRVHVLLVASR
ncbi:MAG: LUD domain-containing protein [Granulosicoccus sp.]|nr:LUD domain-containing protein [Granulosicoccus sp.]